MTRIAILIGSQGRGTNMANIVAAAKSGSIPAEVVAVISPRPATPAVLRAEALGAPIVILSHKEDGYPEKLLQALLQAQVDLVCLAGYMTMLPLNVVNHFEGRILNIHPALLPKYGGKGMYGRHVHEAVLAAGETESGCTVHFVNEVYDEGPILHQRRCPVLPGDTPETLSERVLDLEHTAYVEAINLMLKK